MKQPWSHDFTHICSYEPQRSKDWIHHSSFPNSSSGFKVHMVLILHFFHSSSAKRSCTLLESSWHLPQKWLHFPSDWICIIAKGMDHVGLLWLAGLAFVSCNIEGASCYGMEMLQGGLRLSQFSATARALSLVNLIQHFSEASTLHLFPTSHMLFGVLFGSRGPPASALSTPMDESSRRQEESYLWVLLD